MKIPNPEDASMRVSFGCGTPLDNILLDCVFDAGLINNIQDLIDYVVEEERRKCAEASCSVMANWLDKEFYGGCTGRFPTLRVFLEAFEQNTERS